jgi:hypothetical protein
MNDNPHGKGQFNPCLHVAYRGDPTPKSLHFFSSASGGTSYWETYYTGPVMLTTVSQALAALPPSPVGTADYKSRVYNMFKDMTADVPITVSLPNFLFELREVKDLIPKWEGILKSISGGYLNWQFGWKPMIADIKKLLSSVKDARKRIAELKKLNHKSTTLHRSYEIDMSNDVLQPAKRGQNCTMNVSSLYSNPFTRVSACKCKVTVTVEVYYDLSDLDRQDAFLQTMLTQLGFMNSPKVIWNAIPFSWLLEYFVNLDRVFDSFDNHPFAGTIAVRNSATTIKMDATVECGDWLTDDVNKIISNDWVGFRGVSTTFVERYDRRMGIDLGADIYLDDSLSGSQLAILAALLHQHSS